MWFTPTQLHKVLGGCDPGFPDQVDEWRRLSAEGDPAAFERRLSWLAPLAAPSRDWLEPLREILAAASHSVPGPRSTVPFAELLWPIASWAAARVGPQATTETARVLLARLGRLCAPVLMTEFGIFRGARASGLELVLAQARGEDRQLYTAFLEHLRAGGLVGLLADYPPLGRLLSLTVTCWVEWTAEFFERLEHDRPVLESALGCRGGLVGLDWELSDPHHGGRTAVRVSFENGARAIYKPRSLAMEKAWFDLLSWLAERGAPRLRSLKVVNLGSHGWVEHAQVGPCSHPGAYYRRSGALLCLLYALGGNDAHLENLLACGDDPVLVDVETLFHPPLHQEAGPDVDCVLRTGILPGWMGRGETAMDAGGLGRATGSTPAKRRLFTDVNTDRMAMRVDHSPLKEPAPRPAVEDHEDLLVEGFEEMYGRLIELGPRLLHPRGPLARFRKCEGRYIPWSTAAYSELLRVGSSAARLRDAGRRSVLFDLPARAWSRTSRPQVARRFVAAESAALEAGDVPLFRCRPAQRSLGLPDGRVLEEFFERSGWELTRDRLQRLCPADRDRQVALVREAVGLRSGREFEPEPLTAAGDPAAQAGRIGELLLGATGHPRTWLGVQLVGSDRFQMAPLEQDLYAGTGGVALFLAALARTRGGEEYREAALAALGAQPPQLPSQLGLGGPGGMLLSLLRVESLLGEPRLLDQALEICGRLHADRLQRDTQLDIIGGAAGLIPGLLEVAERTGERHPLEMALRCGEHLLERRTPCGAWATLEGRVLTGFAHGTAGIAWALDRLGRATGEAAFAWAASEAVDYEDRCFLAQAGTWPDLRTSPRTPAAATWCHGPAGIALARLGMERTGEVERAVAAVLAGELPRDHLCCGLAGQAETLLECGRALGRPDWVGAATERCHALAGREAYRLSPGVRRQSHHPSFFTGLAGIGYVLLRSAFPEVLPCSLPV